MEFRILGPVEVLGEEGPLNLGGPKQRAVLAHLLLRAGHVVPIDVLIAQLWGDDPPDAARRTLQAYVSRLRRILGEERIEGRSPGYVLRVAPGELDADGFGSLVTEARGELLTDPGAAVEMLEEALGLWRGPALGDLSDEASLGGEIARLDELRLSAIEEKVSAEFALGRHARLVGELEALTAEHPLRERLWGDLMLALYRSGRQADALGAFRRARGILSEELGIDPSRRLRRLHDRILAQDPALSAPSRPVPALGPEPTPVPGELAPDSVLAGYRIEGLLGRGGMSTVYVVEDLRLRRRVALKVLSPELTRHPGVRERFVRESQIAAGIEHPGIVPIFEAGEAEGFLFLAMRYVRGSDLGRLLAEGGPLDPERAAQIVERVAEALDAAHAEGLVHRDVKPGNILRVADSGSRGRDLVYLSDFGLTKRLEGESAPLTRSGQFVGTVDYVAPEQIEGRRVDGRADVYSLACVLFECLTGNPPHRRETEVATLYAHLEDEPPRLSESRPDLPATLEAVLAKALEKDPGRRYATCGEFALAAREALEPGMGITPARRAALRSVVAAAAVAVAVIALVLWRVGDAGDVGDASTSELPPTATPYFALLTRGPNTDERRLLELVPAGIRDACVPAAPMSPLLGEDHALAAVSCTHANVEVLYEVFGRLGALDAAFGKRAYALGAYGGDCETDRRAQTTYAVGGADVGRVLCGQGSGRSEIVWTDERVLVLGHAVRQDLGDLSLYAWWSEAGPIPEGSSPGKDVSVDAPQVPSGAHFTVITRRAAQRIGGSGSEFWVGTWGMVFRDGTYTIVKDGPRFVFDVGTYVLAKGPMAIVTSTAPFGCEGETAAYRFRSGPGTTEWSLDTAATRDLVGRSPDCIPGPWPLAERPLAPGPGGQIAFEAYGDLYLLDFDRLSQVALTRNSDQGGVGIRDTSPAWSPDGARIAFASDRDGDFDLYVMDADGSHVEQVTDDIGDESAPAWSPDGSMIAFQRTWGVNEATGSIRSALSVVSPDGSGERDLLSRSGVDIGQPSWSPDGTTIAFRIDSAVLIMGSDRAGLTFLTGKEGSMDRVAPVWSPDGGRIVFWGEGDGSAGRLLSVSPGSSDIQPFSPSPRGTRPFQPSWSPDGAWIALADWGENPSQAVYVTRVDGGSLFRISLSGSGARWRPVSP
ncbi:MAG TPA: BTAD domain-containing putative transcriptional regulator [Actinomycetota bacterium]|nr:BTAD domain-containing putative transcriptional regulator [Actinomycetota bacterium]